MRVWVNGDLRAAQGVVDARDRGFALGDGVFETLLAQGGQVADFSAHLRRLSDGAAFLGVPLRFDEARLRVAALETLAANGLTEARAAVRIVLSRGVGPRGLAPPVEADPVTLIGAAPAPAPPEPDPGLQLRTVSIRRNPSSPTARFKTLSYIDNVAALAEARAAGDDDALMLSTDGRVACAAAANVFVLSGSVLRTPRAADGALPGVVRKRLLALAPGLGLRAEERALMPADLGAGTVFLANSLIGLRAARAVDGRASPEPCASFVRLKDAFLAARFEE